MRSSSKSRRSGQQRRGQAGIAGRGYGLEGLERRSLLSATLAPVETISPLNDFGGFGVAAVATRGDLALVGTGNGQAALYRMTPGAAPVLLADYTGPSGEYSFGGAVTFFGEGNSFAISAPLDNEGMVFVYHWPTGDSTPPTPGEAIPLEAENFGDFAATESGDIQQTFGAALAGHGNYLLISTLGDKFWDYDGAVRVVDPFGTGGQVGPTIVSPDRAGTVMDQFGVAIASNGEDIAIYGQNSAFGTGIGNGFAAGVVYHFGANAATQMLRVDGVNSTNFGRTLVYSGETLLVGAYDAPDASGTSRVYQFDTTDGSLVMSYADPEGDGSLWGAGIALSGETLLIGGPSGAGFKGAVYAYDLGNPTPLASATGAEEMGSFGTMVAGLSDGRFLIGDPFGADFMGLVHLYQFTPEEGGEENTPAPTAVAGEDVTAVIDQSVAFSGSASTAAAGRTIVGYEWDFDNDGTVDATTVDASWVYSLPGTYTAVLTVTDDGGKSSTDEVLVTVALPAAPTADAGADQTVLRDAAVAVSATAAGATPLSYAWDFDADGVTDATGAGASFVYTATGVYTVTLVVSDAYGQTATDALTVIVTLPPPPAADAGPAQDVETEQAVAFAGTATAGEGATIALVEWDFDFDGATFDADATGLAPTHTYAAAGTYVVAIRVTDNYGQVDEDTMLVTVSDPATAPGPVGLDGSGNLVVTAPTASAGVFQIGRNADGTISVSSGSTSYGAFSPTGSIVIHGSPTGNLIVISNAVTVPVQFIGGPGTDLVQGGGGSDILIGGGGVDVLSGGGGRDLLIGGSGSDVLVGSGDDDILIAGTTAFDNDPVALSAILAEWRSGRSYTQRVNNLRGINPTADRANGSVFLQADSTVFNDTSLDVLTGSTGQDWYLFNNDGSFLTRDLAIGRSSNELITDLDLIVQ